MKRRLGLTTIILFTVLSCSKQEQSSAAEMSGAVLADAGSSARVTSAAGDAKNDAPAPAAPRMIARRGSMSLIVDRVEVTARLLNDIVTRRGGYVANSRSWKDGDDSRASLTLQVPAASLDAVMTELRGKAVRVENEGITSEEFTQEFVDLESRLRNLRATEEELRTLLTVVRQRTQKAAEILEIHDKVSEIRAEIEQTQGRMLYLRNITSFATLQVELLPAAGVRPVVASGWDPRGIAVSALRALTSTLQWMAGVLIWFMIYILPMLLLASMAIFAFSRLLRLNRA